MLCNFVSKIALMRLRCTFFAILFPLFLAAQVYQGDIWLSSQAAVDSFPLKYPGIKRVAGNFVIGIADTVNLTDITDLSPLAGLEYVFYFYISNNGMLTDLHGLEAMDTLYSVTIYHNPKLQSLYGLHKLRKSDGFTIRQNDTLTNLQGLNSLQYAAAFSVERCKNLISMEGLDSLQTTFFGMTIAGNPRLKSITGMPGLKDCSIEVFKNDSLLHFGYFPTLKSGGFEAYENQSLVDFADLGNNVPETLALNLHHNPKLNSLDPIKKANWCGMGIANNPLLSKIRLDSIGFGNIDISGPAIDEIRYSKADVFGSFKVHHCPRLITLSNALPLADSIQFYYEIYDNDSLTLLHEDWGPRYIRHLTVRDNPRLQEVTGFEGLEETWYPTSSFDDYDWGLVVTSPNLRSVSGFNRLKKGNVRLGSTDTNGADFERVEGFNAQDAEFSRVRINGAQLLHNIIGFNYVRKVTSMIELYQIKDTLSAFAHLFECGPYINWPAYLEVSTQSNCHIDPASFSQLNKLQGVYLDNSSHGGTMIPFPSLETCVNSGVATSNNLTSFSLVGIYPSLRKTKSIGFGNCPRLKSLDGIEGITEFKQSTSPFGTFIAAVDCDSLADCSAICWLVEHANFVPANIPRVYLDNPLFPCDDAASIEHWCDTLTTSTKPEPNLEAAPLMRLYPNPVQVGCLNIEMNNPEFSGQYQIMVSDVSGRVALAGRLTFTQGNTVLNTSMLAPGWYQLSVLQHQGVVSSAPFLQEGQ